MTDTNTPSNPPLCRWPACKKQSGFFALDNLAKFGHLCFAHWMSCITHEEQQLYAKPNLAHGNIEVRWYKHPGRGMSLNVDATTEQIISWFDAVIRAICDRGNGVLDLAVTN